MVANTPGEIVCCAVLALPTALIAGRLGFAGRTWKALACESTSKPEITLTSELTVAALAATEIFACRRVGPSTHTRCTVMSSEPKPTVTWPSTKEVLCVVMSIIPVAPEGSEGRLKDCICGGPPLG